MIFTPRACTRGKVIGSVVIVVAVRGPDFCMIVRSVFATVARLKSRV